MHTAIVIAGGLALPGIMILLAKMSSEDRTTAAARACTVFVPAWAVAAAVNMTVGVMRARYSFAAEAPIFLFVFGVPAVVACFVRRKFFRH